MKLKFDTYHICLLAFAIAINFVGGQIALYLHLPIYLDSIGTFFVAAVCGSVYGMIPNVLSGLIMWMLGDAYALYYAPIGMLLGFLTGIVWKKKYSLFLKALIITLPTSFLSACITSVLFGGITSSGSTVLVQLLAQKMNLTLACFIVQIITDYCDRIIGLWIVLNLLKKIPSRLFKHV